MFLNKNFEDLQYLLESTNINYNTWPMLPEGWGREGGGGGRGTMPSHFLAKKFLKKLHMKIKLQFLVLFLKTVQKTILW